jgi:hypothetical protein
MSDSLKEYIQNNLKLRKLAPEFRQIFGVNLNDYFDNLFGLNVIDFDMAVAKPFDYDGEHCESTYQAVYRKWGEPGVRLLVKFDPLSDCEETLKELRDFRYPPGFEHLQRKE